MWKLKVPKFLKKLNVFLSLMPKILLGWKGILNVFYCHWILCRLRMWRSQKRIHHLAAQWKNVMRMMMTSLRELFFPSTQRQKMIELDNQIEEKRMILKSLEDLDSVRKRFDAAEQVEDALTDLKVLEFDGNIIRLQLRTYIPKLDGFLGQHKLEHTTEPSEVIHELLIHLNDKTTEITKIEIFPNDLYIGDIIEAADSFRQVRLHSAVLDPRSSVQ